MTKEPPSKDFYTGLLAAALIWPAAVYLILPGSLAKAFVFMKIWDWYFVPAFGVQPLRFLYSWAIMMGYLALSARKRPKDDTSIWVDTLGILAGCIIILGISWAGTLFL